MRFSAIQPYITLIASVISAIVATNVVFLTCKANQKLEGLKSELQVQTTKKIEPFKDSINKQMEYFKTSLQLGITKETESFKSSLSSELEGFKSDLQLNIIKETEPLKAALSRDNIAFQIHSSEFLKMRFQKINELFTSILFLQDYLSRSKLTAGNDGDGSGQEGYLKRFEQKRLECEIKIDEIYSKSYGAVLYFDSPIRPQIEKYILSVRRVILYSQFYVKWNDVNNFKLNQPDYKFSMDLPEEDEKKRIESRYEQTINGKTYILEPQKHFYNSDDYRIAVEKRLDREQAILKKNFSELEISFKQQLMSSKF